MVFGEVIYYIFPISDHSSVVDPGSPRGTPIQPIILAIFSWKLCEIEKNWTKEGQGRAHTLPWFYLYLKTFVMESIFLMYFLIAQK